MKTCTKCGASKDRAEFYAQPSAKDGRMAICKECHKAGVKANRTAKSEYYREYDRKRGFDDERVAARKVYQEEMRKNPDFVARQGERGKVWRDKNAVKRRAHIMLGNAIRGGIVAKGTRCERCGSTDDPLSGHHEDYYRPLEVVWLCGDCHGLRHREINELKRAGHDLSCRGF